MPLLIVVAAAMIGLGMISPIFSSTYASAGGAELGLVYAAFSISRALFGPVFGRLSDRVGRRRMIALGLATYSVVSILYVVEESLFRLLHGVASVSVTPIAQAYGGIGAALGSDGRRQDRLRSGAWDGPPRWNPELRLRDRCALASPMTWGHP